MKVYFPILLFVVLISCTQEKVKFAEIPVTYPKSLRDTVTDNYHGQKVSDPYRWLEYDTSEARQTWIEEESNLTESYLSKIPFRDAIKNRIEKLASYERLSIPFSVGKKYYTFKQSGLQNQSILYVQDDLNSEPRIVIDPNKLSDDGTVSLSTFSFNKAGDKMAFALKRGGSDWTDIHVMELTTGKILSDTLHFIKFAQIGWFGDGFFYNRYPESKKTDMQTINQNRNIYYHKLGDPQRKDRLVYSDPKDPTNRFSCETTEDEQFLIISGGHYATGNTLIVKDLTRPESRFVNVITDEIHSYSVLDHRGDSLLIYTDYGTSNSRVVLVPIKNSDEKNWKTIIPESEEVLSNIISMNGKLVAIYTKDAFDKIVLFDPSGKRIQEAKMPGLGSVGQIGSGKPNEILFSFVSFIQPPSIYSLDINSGDTKLVNAPAISFDPNNFITKQVIYTSKDGTKIPMFITHKKDLKLTGDNPTLLLGFGGFGATHKPNFSTMRIPLLESNGIFAVANIRGGGEYGEKWHEAAIGKNRQTAFDDFVAATDFLIQEGYTSREKLGIEGSSNGGLLVTSCITQHPDLCKVVLAHLPITDMLRYQNFTIGRGWAAEFGLSENPDDFKYLYRYSPLHNVKEATYPATLILTADHDDRVVPAHSYKFTAELQFKQKGSLPVLVRIDRNSGHAEGTSLSKLIQINADALAFFFYNVNQSFESPDK